MAEREVECFSGVKTAQNSKTEGGTERQKKNNKQTKCEAEGRRCAWGDFTSRKTRRMHRETARCRDGFTFFSTQVKLFP